MTARAIAKWAIPLTGNADPRLTASGICPSQRLFDSATSAGYSDRVAGRARLGLREVRMEPDR